MQILLENIINDLPFDDLPDTWAVHNFIDFSKHKKMFDYQIDALKNAVKALYFYYERNYDYKSDEPSDANTKRKKAMLNTYRALGLIENALHLKNNKKNRPLHDIYSKHFPAHADMIPAFHFMNRMSFWMATGSGKSLVIIKLFSILDRLIKNKEIPPNDFLFLSPSNKLIEQTKALIDEYNQTSEHTFIEFIDLREFHQYKMNYRINLGEIPVFYYRSDLISDETKESIINYTEYDNHGNWYMFLDEAHKGDKGDSKRQAYYTCMARNGFQFNFSATFTDDLDIATTVKDFKLKHFVKAGYGKNIIVSNSQYSTFNETEDEFTEAEKQLIVLKSLIMLAYIKQNKMHFKHMDDSMYHSPLMLTLVNSVNKSKSDLLLFFKEIEKIALGHYEQNLFEQAKEELLEEFKNNPAYEFDNGTFTLNETIFHEISIKTILQSVFNSEHHGSIEVITTNDNQELAFRLKSSAFTSSPFALIKIGDVTPWIKEHLSGYEFVQSFADKKFFNELNHDPNIHILIGSRAFYEGWDSPRPNIINYINIGSSTDAKKYVTQSAGRGVRVEPLKNERKRLVHLFYMGKISGERYEKCKKYASALETLFIFATNKNAIRDIINGLNEEDDQTTEEKEFALNKNVNEETLIVPVYKRVKSNRFPRFKLARESMERLKAYVQQTPDAVLALQYVLKPSEIKVLKKIVNEEMDVIHYDETVVYRDLKLLIQRFVEHIRLKEKVVGGFKQIDSEISHFQKIKINKQHYDIIKEKVNEVKASSESKYTKHQLLEMHKNGEISIEQYTELLLENVTPATKKEAKYRDVIIKYVDQHYYAPYIYAENEKIDYMKHIIKVKSEVKFLKALEQYITKPDNQSTKFDWWKFSKIDENLDHLYIPYYDENKYKKYKPDFIFWLKKNEHIKLIFVDPKGTQHTAYQKKADGFRNLFENQQFQYEQYTVTVDLKLYSEEMVTGLYERYWFNNFDDLFQIE